MRKVSSVAKAGDSLEQQRQIGGLRWDMNQPLTPVPLRIDASGTIYAIE